MPKTAQSPGPRELLIRVDKDRIGIDWSDVEFTRKPILALTTPAAPIAPVIVSSVRGPAVTQDSAGLPRINRAVAVLSAVAIVALAAVGLTFARSSSPTAVPDTSVPVLAFLPAAVITPVPSAQQTLLPSLTVAPIDAVFDQSKLSTGYGVTIKSPSDQRVTVTWAGPNCGEWDARPQTLTGQYMTLSMVWQHPHPPCGATTNHSDVTVTLTITYAGGTLFCSYVGTESGTGPPCGNNPPGVTLLPMPPPDPPTPPPAAPTPPPATPTPPPAAPTPTPAAPTPPPTPRPTPTRAVQGTVTDTVSGVPLAGVCITITLQPILPSTPCTTTTDPIGKYYVGVGEASRGAAFDVRALMACPLAPPCCNGPVKIERLGLVVDVPTTINFSLSCPRKP
ncbi:MAG TPA: hypothetical protein VHG53_00210 [Candidatus Limnocylindria bacterium]|nr:hypothetical protein [Candidatus Limnocylindria bacterium]